MTIGEAIAEYSQVPDSLVAQAIADKIDQNLREANELHLAKKTARVMAKIRRSPANTTKRILCGCCQKPIEFRLAEEKTSEGKRYVLDLICAEYHTILETFANGSKVYPFMPIFVVGPNGYAIEKSGKYWECKHCSSWSRKNRFVCFDCGSPPEDDEIPDDEPDTPVIAE